MHFEMINVMTALRVWGPAWRDQRIKVHCDNAAVVEVLNRGASRDTFLCACARTIWLIKAKYNLQLLVVHIRGADNVYADMLSRWSHVKNLNTSVVKHIKSCTWYEVDISDLQPNFSI